MFNLYLKTLNNITFEAIKLYMLKRFLLLVFFYVAVGCKEDKINSQKHTPAAFIKTNLKYATGFTITKHNTYSRIAINTPWPNAKRTLQFIITSRLNAAKINLNKDEYDGIIITPIEKIIVTSTTHLPALELLGVQKTLVGFPGTHYVSSKKIRQQLDSGFIRELGKNESLNTEVVLELQPDVVIGFGIDGNNSALEIIKKSGIPVMFNGDWAEKTPLAKAEWIKFFGVLFNKENAADSIFNHIEKNYNTAKKLALGTTQKPTMLSGAMHGNVWYLPNGTSTEAQFFKDANVNYLWSSTKGTGSLKLNFESVFLKAKNASIWLNPSNYTSYKTLKNANKNHSAFVAYKKKNIYTFANTTGVTGGILYYELGITRPDLVLKDIIKISHPQLLKNYEPYFIKPLK